MDGYTVAPVQFTEKQANALITAQHLVNQTNDSSFAKDFDEAFTKIKSVFRSSIQETSELLNSKIRVFNFKDEKVPSSALSEIQLAITSLTFVEINYRKADGPEITFRKVKPYAMYSVENKWILIAWCHLRNTYRAFRIDRIQHYKILPDKFEDRKFDLQKYFKEDAYRNKMEGPKKD